MNHLDIEKRSSTSADTQGRAVAAGSLDDRIRQAAFHHTPHYLAQRVKNSLGRERLSHGTLVCSPWTRAVLTAAVMAAAVGVGHFMGGSVSEVLQQRAQAQGIEFFESDTADAFTDFFSENGAEEKFQ